MNARQTIKLNPEPASGKEVLRAALASYRPGYSLPQAFYKDPTIFQMDMRHYVLAHWHCVGHTSMVREPGDFFTVDIAGESLIIVRGEDQQIHCLVNVCRHRGSRVCLEHEGKARGGNFVCPYHAWTYDTTGALQRARVTPEGFDREKYGLKTLQVRVCEGIIFVTQAEKPLGFKHVEEAFGKAARVYDWANAKVAARKMYMIQGNWKLVTENYSECYHCGPAHQEYSRRHIFARPQDQRLGPDTELRARDKALGIPLLDYDFLADRCEPGEEFSDSFPSAMVDGYHTGSRDGKPVAPLLGQFKGKEFDDGFTFIDVGPTSNFISYPDYGLVYRSIPHTADSTAFELIWLVDGDAVEGKDYDVENLIWMWDYTSIEDKKIIEMNQAGVNSAYYEPGPYTPMEADTDQYIQTYISAMRKAAE